MLGRGDIIALGLVAALLGAVPGVAAPQVVTLGGDSTGDADAVAACGALAASPFEAGWTGRGLDDKQIFLDGAVTACEAALKAAPESVEARTWLGRVYLLVGRKQEAKTLLGEASDAGSAFAAYLLSELLEKPGDYSEIDDPDRVLQLLQQSADAGFAPAQFALGSRYENANGVEQDYAHALELYETAMVGGHGEAAYRAGYFYQSGLAVDTDYGKAAVDFQQAVDLGAVTGWFGLGQIYQFGQGVDIDLAKAAEDYQHGADAGEMMSETALAYLYGEGQGVPKDAVKSFMLLSDAADQGYGLAQANLSINYLFGQGTEVDAKKAFDLAWAAVGKQIVFADGVLGYMYSEGLGTNRDLSSALQHFQTGADGGDQYSSDRLPVVEAELACEDQAGSQYEPGANGHGVDFDAIDTDAAIGACQAALDANPESVGDKVWLARALAKADRYDEALPLIDEGIEAGNVLAETLGGDIILGGKSEVTDPAKALELYNRAGGKDFPLALYALGTIYADGKIVPADILAALGWFRRASDLGMAPADDKIAELATPAEESVDLTVGFGREGPAY